MGGGGGWIGFFIENPRRGGKAGRRRAAGRVSAANCFFFLGGGGTPNIFFGAEMSSKTGAKKIIRDTITMVSSMQASGTEKLHAKILVNSVAV